MATSQEGLSKKIEAHGGHKIVHSEFHSSLKSTCRECICEEQATSSRVILLNLGERLAEENIIDKYGEMSS